MKVYVDPQTEVDYSAFYIEGLYEIYGEKNIEFNLKYFKNLHDTKKFRFVTIEEEVFSKYVIDWGDDCQIDDEDYDWCDYYGKININLKKTPVCYYKKIRSIAPGFGIRIWGKYESAFYSIANLVNSKTQLSHIRKFVSKYYKQYNNLTLDYYVRQLSKKNYIYSLNTLWNSNEWINNDDTVNQYRANFINACRSLSMIYFEGGFVYGNVRNDNPKFSSMIVNSPWIPKEEYVKKIKESLLVFNTPAWALCHGWKLGEYLAMGKAIISTPILNELPAPLEHGKHIHIVSGEESEIKDAVELLIQNKEYRNYLETNAYEYYQKYASPVQSIRLLVNH